MSPQSSLTLLPPRLRKEKIIENRKLLLNFLRQEIWSTSDILRIVLKLRSRQGIAKVLNAFREDGLIERHEVRLVNEQKIVLWGITAHGQAMAFDPESEKVIPTYFEPSKIHDSTLRHTLDIQRLRTVAEQHGWKKWINGDRLTKLLNDDRRPDALAMSTNGELIAIEVERTIKTVKRYQSILASYLRAIKLNEVVKVIWLCPTEDLTKRLQSIVSGITYVVVEGQRISIDPERHHVNLAFMSYTQFECEACNL
jgi:hypothetical protein